MSTRYEGQEGSEGDFMDAPERELGRTLPRCIQNLFIARGLVSSILLCALVKVWEHTYEIGEPMRKMEK